MQDDTELGPAVDNPGLDIPTPTHPFTGARTSADAEREPAMWIRCNLCNWKSYSPEDIEHRYCGACHRTLAVDQYLIGSTGIIGGQLIDVPLFDQEAVRTCPCPHLRGTADLANGEHAAVISACVTAAQFAGSFQPVRILLCAWCAGRHIPALYRLAL